MKHFLLCSLMLIAFVGISISSRVPSKNSLNQRKVLSAIAGETEQLFIKEYKNYIKTGVKTSMLQGLIEYLRPPLEARRKEIYDIDVAKQNTICALCRAVVGVMLDYRRDGVDDEFFEVLAIDLCKTLEIQPDDVCDGVIVLNIPSLLYIIDNRPNLTSETVCGIILQGSDCVIPDYTDLEFTINVDQNGPAISASKDFDVQKQEDDLVIVQVTDIHYDAAYRAGANAVCSEPICCRGEDGEPSNPANGAGKWGDYRDCDTPWETVVDVLEQIKREHKRIDAVYFTGDIIDHGVWETTVEGHRHAIKRVYDQFKTTFGNIPVFPIMGNHEGQPVNQFPPLSVTREDIDIQWLYNLIAEQWESWLPADTQETIKNGGYYTVLVKPGFRIIALNNNGMYTFNWWLFYEASYLAEQLQWLHDTLLLAEKNNEKVHILAHIPSNEGFKIWSREYRRVIERFWNTISGVFNGHTHNDEFNIFYSREKPEHAINVGWNGGSATTFSDVNYNYRLYYVEQKDYLVTEHETWIFNLTEANLTPDKNPVWFKAYSFQEAYGVKSLSPKNLDILAENLSKDPKLMQTYWEYKMKLGDTSLAKGCDQDCMANHLCQIVQTEYNVDDRCFELLENWGKN